MTSTMTVVLAALGRLALTAFLLYQVYYGSRIALVVSLALIAAANEIHALTLRRFVRNIATYFYHHPAGGHDGHDDHDRPRTDSRTTRAAPLSGRPLH